MSVTESTLRPRGQLFRPTDELRVQSLLPEMARSLPGARHGLSCITDFIGPIGIPDMVAVVGDAAALERRANLSIPPIRNLIDASIITVLDPRRSTSIDDLVGAIPGVTWGVLERRVSQLTRIGAINELPTAQYVRHPALVSTNTIYAFEAKVRDWNKGFAQALRYSTWADAACVILERVPTDLNGLLSAASKSGLAVAHQEKWLIRPRLLRRLLPARRFLASESVYENMQK